MNYLLTKKNEKGIALPITLFVLIGLLLSVMLLIRSSDVAVTVSGNVGVHTQLTGSNTNATAAAVKWLNDNSATLDSDNTAAGYFSAQSSAAVDYTYASSWVNAYTYNSTVDSYGNVNQYFIIRMCTLPNTPYNGSASGVQNICSMGSSAASTTGTSSVGYDVYNFGNSVTTAIYYKIITRSCTKTCPGFSGYINQIKNGVTITETVVKI